MWCCERHHLFAAGSSSGSRSHMEFIELECIAFLQCEIIDLYIIAPVETS